MEKVVFSFSLLFRLLLLCALLLKIKADELESISLAASNVKQCSAGEIYSNVLKRCVEKFEEQEENVNSTTLTIINPPPRKCTDEEIFECPRNAYYDQKFDKCIDLANDDELEVTGFSITGNLPTRRCRPGFRYQKPRNICIKDFTFSQTAEDEYCPDSTYYDVNLDSCIETGYGVSDESPKQLHFIPLSILGALPSRRCKNGYEYQEDRKICYKKSVKTFSLPVFCAPAKMHEDEYCPENYLYDAAKDMCVPTNTTDTKKDSTATEDPEVASDDIVQFTIISLPRRKICMEGGIFDQRRKMCKRRNKQ
ncbi:Hypothetical predicted protein [Cloeon dipterum]|uniref:Chitin-binding type-2 domain-containing protein n=1 Tax=Cloeon dipterum TaxID=197152 RepID=A0A8S1DCX4_9INSE|nr:Hypothetical predicted protein [Cloeon dipterum]